jgi:hypothetical protein
MSNPAPATPSNEIRSNFPAELKSKHIWCLYSWPEKIPCQPNGKPAKVNEPSTWSSFDACVAVTEKGEAELEKLADEHDVGLGPDDYPELLPGLGIFADGSHTFIDLDKCVAPDGAIEPWAQAVLCRCNSYAEYSPSGTGLHIFVNGAVPKPVKINGCEMYSEKRFFTVTGKHVDGTPLAVNAMDSTLWDDIAEDRLRPYNVATGSPSHKSGLIATRPMSHAERTARLEKALRDHLSDYGGDRSAAIHGALQLLARKHQGNEAAMRGEFEPSALCAAWEEKGKWSRLGESEIGKAIQDWKKNGSPTWGGDELSSSFLAPRVEGSDYAYVVGGDGEEEGWFPRGDVSLIGGYSGAGKSTFGLDMLEKQATGERFFGRETFKLPYLVLLADRSPRSLRRTMHRMKIDLEALPHRTFDSSLTVAENVERAIVESTPSPAVLFLEGIDLLGNDASKSADVARLLRSLARLADHYFVAVIGSTGSPKIKAKDGYKSARELFIGSGSWSRLVETEVLIQRERETDEVTTMTVLPRQSKPIQFHLRFQSGRFVEVPASEIAAADASKADREFLTWVFERESFTRAEAQRAFRSMSGGYLTRRIDGYLKAGVLKRRTKGARVWYDVPSAIPQNERAGVDGRTEGVGLRDTAGTPAGQPDSVLKSVLREVS